MTVPGHEKVIARLEAAGLNYIAPEPLFLEDVYRDIEQIAGLLEVLPRGRAVVAAMRGRIGPPSLEVPGPRPSILVEWWPKPVIAPGRQSWVTDMIELAGGTNPLSDRDVKSMPMEDQEVRHLDPDAFVIAWCGVRTEKYRPQVLYRNPAWRELAALKNRRVYCVPEAYLGRPSPRLVEGFEALREILAELGAR
jgi:iron complex transport system substrate-binding protein